MAVVAEMGADIDGAVRRIAFSYTNRGQHYEVTQYSATTSGSVVNQVKYTYDDYGRVARVWF